MTIEPAPRVQLRRLVLENIRCFDRLELDFTDLDAGNAVPWTVLLGNNGSGKSTVLKAVALALAPPHEAHGLFGMDPRSSWLRRGKREGSIALDLSTGRRLLRLRSTPRGEILEIPTDEDDYGQSAPPLVCGYGAARRSFGTSSPQGYSVRNAVATLFDTEAPLQNPELAVRRMLSASSTGEADLLQRIDQALTLPLGSTRLGQEGIEVNGPWGSFMPIGALSDGYRSTLSWLLDFVGWALLSSRSEPNWVDQPPAGIVLLDEIEQHLHPRWQRRIIGKLRSQLPNVQFLVTTHAPLCVTGTTDLADEEINLVHLSWAGQAVEASPPMKPPRGQRADQILTSYLFGLETTSDDETKEQIERLSGLLARSANLGEAEAQEVTALRDSLQGVLGSAETKTEALVAVAVEKALDSQILASLEASVNPDQSLDPEIARLEARRQLLKVLGEEPGAEIQAVEATVP